MLASLFEPNSQNTGTPCALITIPYGLAPRVGTSRNSNLPLYAEKAGTVKYVDSSTIRIDEEEYKLSKYRGLNERTTQNHKPRVTEGDRHRKLGDVSALRIELPDVPLVVRGEPDLPLAVSDEPVRSRIGPGQRIFAKTSALRVEPSELVRILLRDPQRGIGRHRRIVGPRIARG